MKGKPIAKNRHIEYYQITEKESQNIIRWQIFVKTGTDICRWLTCLEHVQLWMGEMLKHVNPGVKIKVFNKCTWNQWDSKRNRIGDSYLGKIRTFRKKMEFCRYMVDYGFVMKVLSWFLSRGNIKKFPKTVFLIWNLDI